jgi:hypothetical protein
MNKGKKKLQLKQINTKSSREAIVLNMNNGKHKTEQLKIQHTIDIENKID